jgi:hypothetical protein
MRLIRSLFYVSDEYMVNSVMMNLNKKKLKELLELLLDADVIAKENAMLDNLNLGEFQSNYGKLSLNSHKGALKGDFRFRNGDVRYNRNSTLLKPS